MTRTKTIADAGSTPAGSTIFFDVYNLRKYLIEGCEIEEAVNFTRDDFIDVWHTAKMAHMGQERRDGSEYFTHPSEVRNIVRKFYPKDYAAQMVALLHDSLEDAPGNTVDSIEEMEEFIRGSIQSPESGEVVIDTVKALTHEKNAPYVGYVVNLLNNPLALRVKLADMVHNLKDSPSDRQKEKYAKSIVALSDASGGIPQGIDPKHWEVLTSLTESREMAGLRSLIKEVLLA